MRHMVCSTPSGTTFRNFFLLRQRRSSNHVPIISSRLSAVTTERLCFPVDKEVSMARRRKKTITDRIFENILFLEEVFGDKDDADILDVPVLELAKCFELSHTRTLRTRRVAETS